MKKIIEKYSKKPEGLFKMLFVTFQFGYLPIVLLHIILNITNVVPVNFNDKGVYGIEGVIIIIIYTPFIVLLLSGVTWIYFMFGNLVLRLLKKLFL
jgi:hypothetical protein